MPKPTEAMREEARRGLDWRKEYGRGGTEVGMARARDIVNNRDLSMERFRRMDSWFSILSSNLIFHFDRVLRNLLQFLVVCLSARVQPKCYLSKN